MKVFKAWFLSFLILNPSLGWAWGEACPEDVEAISADGNELQEEYDRLAVQLREDFSVWEKASAETIVKSLECLETDSAHDDCQTRLSYFYHVLPGELSTYRKNLALSRWDTGWFARVARDKIDKDSPYNWRLKNPGSFYRGHAQPDPLIKQSDEHLEIQAMFERKIEVDFKAVLEEFGRDPEGNLTHPQFTDDPNFQKELERQYQIVLDRDLHAILVDPNQNHLASRVIDRFSKRVFPLSKKRLVNQLVAHPLLAMISSRDITKDSLVEALGRMQENLDQEFQEIQGHFDKIQNRLDKPELSVLSRNFYPLLEYTMIVEGVGVRNEGLCPVVKLVDRHYSNSQWLKIGLGGAALVGLIAVTFYFSVPVLLLAGGGAVVSGYMVYDANDELNEVANRSFLSPEERLNLSNSEDVYQASEEFNDEVYIYAPLTAVMGGPLLKIGKIFKFAGSK